MIKVDNEVQIPTRKFEEWKIGSYLKPFNYKDAIHLFGKPVKVIGQEHRVYWRITETQKDGFVVYAQIQDDGLNADVKDTVNFDIICHCDRSFEIVSEFIGNEYKKGKRPLTRDLKPPLEEQERHELTADNKAENEYED